jgi:hypothetical protein
MNTPLAAMVVLAPVSQPTIDTSGNFCSTHVWVGGNSFETFSDQNVFNFRHSKHFAFEKE